MATSDPIDCLDDRQTDTFIAADCSPTTRPRPHGSPPCRRSSAACKANSPNLVGHVSTRDVAKDMDILRQALGDQKLAYLGKSYGTAIGSTYTELFPQNVGRLVLDGAIDPALDLTEMGKGQALLRARAEPVLRRLPHARRLPVPEGRRRRVGQAGGAARPHRRHPAAGATGAAADPGVGLLGVVGNLYSPESWPELAYALQAAFDGDGNALLNSADYYADRNTDGTYNSNANDALYAVNCFDRPTRGHRDGGAGRGVAEGGPHFGAYLAWGNLPCATWPAHSRSRRTRSPLLLLILVVGPEDPATPVGWAKALAGQLDMGAAGVDRRRPHRLHPGQRLRRPGGRRLPRRRPPEGRRRLPLAMKGTRAHL